ncbi:MAG: aminotransferase class V-fold PLP-dependent enzyme [Crocinitomicaceae bacterium]|nr:aminotransferase class V-fold PLP-dependent enzyme [Crocinitomicaceae bacterium]
MNSSRRKFIRNAGLTLGAASLLDTSLFAGSAETESMQKQFSDFNSEADYWEWVRQSYTVSSNIINLNNGGVSPQPKVVQEVFEQYNRQSNEGPSYYMWRILDKGREAVRQNLAELGGCLPEEIAIQRNATEALDTIIFGLNLEKGDEVIVTNYDYPNMRNAWLQREKRDGIKLVWISIPLNVEDDDAIVKLFTDAITSKTKIIHITHIINWTGQILPAKKIAAKAHEKNIEVVLDAAHTFAHINFSFHDLDVDYAGTSLHKWLCAPFGTGMLYIKKSKIAGIWPIFPTDKPESEDIKKFEALGTRSFPAEMAVGRAISFHNSIGSDRKQARLKFLQQYWVNKVKDHPKIKFYTPLGDDSCAIATVGIEGMQAGDIESKLFEKKSIHTVAIIWEGVNGIRVTPHVYTSTSDLDKLVEGLLEIAG